MVRSFWNDAAQRAGAATLHALGMETRQRVLVKVGIVAAVLFGLWWFGSEGASRDELIARIFVGLAVVSLFPIIFCWNLVKAPAEMFDEQLEQNANLRSDLASAKAELEKRPVPNMIGSVSQFIKSETPHAMACNFNITIKNQGSPSMIESWDSYFVHKNGGRIRGKLGHIVDKMTFVHEDGSSQMLVTADSIVEKALRTPIPQGGILRGWLTMAFPLQIREHFSKDYFYEISFTDAFEKKHTFIAEHGTLKKRLDYVPDGSGGVSGLIDVPKKPKRKTR